MRRTTHGRFDPVQYTRAELDASLRELDRLGVDIKRFELLKRGQTKPYNHFGEQFTDEDQTG